MTPEQEKLLEDLVNENAARTGLPDPGPKAYVDPELGTFVGKWLGIKFWMPPDRGPMPAWMLRLERRSPKALLPFLVVFVLLTQMQSFALGAGILVIIFPEWVGLPSLNDFEAIQAATPLKGIISVLDYAFVGIIGLLGAYWSMVTLPPKRIRFLYGSFLVPALLAAGGMVFMAAPQRSRSGAFLISHFLDRSGGKEELFTVVDDLKRNKLLLCKSTFTCTTQKFRISRVSAPQDTWEIGVEQLTEEVRRDISVRPPFRFWGKVREGIPGLRTLDIRSIRLDDSIHGYVGQEQYWGDYGGKLRVRLRPSSLDRLKGTILAFVYLPSSWPRPEAEQIVEWLKAIDATDEVAVVEQRATFNMRFGGESLFDRTKPLPFPFLDVNSNLNRACKFIEDDQERLYSASDTRKADETAVGLFAFCLLDKEGHPFFQGDLRKSSDRDEAIRQIMAALKRPGD